MQKKDGVPFDRETSVITPLSFVWEAFFPFHFSQSVFLLCFQTEASFGREKKNNCS